MSVYRPVLAAALALPLLLAGCNSDGDVRDIIKFEWLKYEARGPYPPGVVGPACSAPVNAELRIIDRLGQQTDAFIQGEVILFELHITNESAERQTFQTPAGHAPIFFYVVDRFGNIVNPTCRLCAYTTAIVNYPFDPGETQVVAFEWNQVMDNGRPAPPGEYRMHADDATYCRPKLSDSRSFTIQ